MSMNDLFTALNMFKQGVDDIHTARVMEDANRQVQQIKSSELNEQQQRAQLSALSDQLVMRMAGLGVPATTIAQAASAVAPKVFANPDQAILEGKLTGSHYLQESGQEAARLARQDEIQQQGIQRAWQSRENELNRKAAVEAAQTKATNLRGLTDGEVLRLTEQENVFQMGDDLAMKAKGNPKLIGILAGRIKGREALDPEFAAFKADVGRFFDKYRLATTGQGAGQQEMEMLTQRVAQESDSPEAFQAKLTSYLNEVQKNRSTYIKNLSKAKKDVTQFSPDLNGRYKEKSAPDGMTTVKVKDRKSGLLVDAYKDAQGNLYKVK